MTLDLVRWIKDIYPEAAVRIFRFIPYPKMPILKDIERLLPVSTYEWSRVTYQRTKLLNIPKKIDDALHILSPASLYSVNPQGLSLKNLVIKILFYITWLRFKMRLFLLPLEGILVEKIYSRISSKILQNFNDSFKRCMRLTVTADNHRN